MFILVCLLIWFGLIALPFIFIGIARHRVEKNDHDKIRDYMREAA